MIRTLSVFFAFAKKTDKLIMKSASKKMAIPQCTGSPFCTLPPQDVLMTHGLRLLEPLFWKGYWFRSTTNPRAAVSISTRIMIAVLHRSPQIFASTEKLRAKMMAAIRIIRTTIPKSRICCMASSFSKNDLMITGNHTLVKTLARC